MGAGVLMPEVRRWAVLYEHGWPLHRIAAAANRSVSTVHRLLLADGVVMRPRAASGRGRPPGTNGIVLGRKFCARCRHWRHVCDFSASSRTPRLKLDTYCRACRRITVRERLAADPELLRAVREDARIRQTDRRRREGVAEAPWRTIPPDPASNGDAPGYLRRRLEPGPLAARVRAWVAAHDATAGFGGQRALADRACVSERLVYALLRGERGHVHYAAADRLAVAMGLTLALVYGDA